MAQKVRIKFNPKMNEHLDSKGLPLVEAKVKAIEEACNSASSWGGYHSAAGIRPGGTAAGTVWSADNRNDEGRDNRLVKNLDA